MPSPHDHRRDTLMYTANPNPNPYTPPSSDVEPTKKALSARPLKPKRDSGAARVNRLLAFLKARFRGAQDSDSDSDGNSDDWNDWRAFPLSEDEYQTFETRLRSDAKLAAWYEDKVRYDWNPTQGVFVVRMSSYLHDVFARGIEYLIHSKVQQLATDLSGKDEADVRIAAELNKLYPGGSSTFELEVPELESSSQGSNTSGDSLRGGAGPQTGQIAKKSPDVTFYHPRHPVYPTLLAEVAYSQNANDLPDLAYDYVTYSAHCILAVIAFKIPYRRFKPSARRRKLSEPKTPPQTAEVDADRTDKSASYSLWRPGFEGPDEDEDESAMADPIGTCVQHADDVQFRTSSGNPGTGALELRLSDLLPQTDPDMAFVPRSKWESIKLFIPHTAIAECLSAAEAAQFPSPATRARVQAQRARAPKRFKKRKRDESKEPTEILDQANAAEVNREEERAALIDDDYEERPLRRSINRKVARR